MKDQPSYYDEVYSIVRLIPKGKVCTYGIVANLIGLGSARMVGWALNKSGGVKPKVPAHRVVNRKGELSGRNFFSSPDLMQQLLEKEGIIVLNNVVKDFDKILWNPSEEIIE